MATAPIFVINHGNVEATEPEKDLPGFPTGTRLRLVSSNDRELVFRREQSAPHSLTGEQYMAVWRSMKGIMQDGIDTDEESAREKAEELERDRRKFGDR